MKNLAPPGAQSRAEVLVESLTRAIVQGEYSTGARLPSEKDLQAKCGVSRQVVREAMKMLASSGLAHIEQGRGAFVCENDHAPLRQQIEWMLQRSESESASTRNAAATKGSARKTARGSAAQEIGGFHHLLDVRPALETAVAERAALRADETDIAALEAAIAALEKGAARPSACVAADLQFHRALAGATHNPLWAALLDSLNDLLQGSISTGYRGASFAANTAKEHRAVLDAVKNRDALAAGAAMRNHLQTSREDLRGALSTESAASTKKDASTRTKKANRKHSKAAKKSARKIK